MVSIGRGGATGTHTLGLCQKHPVVVCEPVLHLRTDVLSGASHVGGVGSEIRARLQRVRGPRDDRPYHRCAVAANLHKIKHHAHGRGEAVPMALVEDPTKDESCNHGKHTDHARERFHVPVIPTD